MTAVLYYQTHAVVLQRVTGADIERACVGVVRVEVFR